MANKGEVILFGKTGAGKSTIANVLVTGGISNERFEIGHGFRGCTSAITTLEGRGWTVTDTAGLGESNEGAVPDEEAKRMILEFLGNIRRPFSHIIYVKSVSDRFTVMDKAIWKIFRRVFIGASEAFVIVFTGGSPQWLDENWDSLPLWAKELGRHNVLIVDIPPVDANDSDGEETVRERRNREVRADSYARLEQGLCHSLNMRNGARSTPNVSNMDNEQTEIEAESILTWIKQLVETIVTAAQGIATVVREVLGIVRTFKQ